MVTKVILPYLQEEYYFATFLVEGIKDISLNPFLYTLRKE